MGGVEGVELSGGPRCGEKWAVERDSLDLTFPVLRTLPQTKSFGEWVSLVMKAGTATYVRTDRTTPEGLTIFAYAG